MNTAADLDQRTQRQAWLMARLGKVTASRIADVMAKTKTGPAASRDAYKAELVVQRLTGRVADGFTTVAMQHGIDTEPLARAAYESEHGVLVLETGFHDHPEIAMSGASPDGLIGADGLIEIKCRQPAGHLEDLEAKTPPKKYVLQMQWQMAVTGRAWCDYASFNPEFPDHLSLRVMRVERDDALIAEIEAEVRRFLDEVAEAVFRLEKQAA